MDVYSIAKTNFPEFVSSLLSNNKVYGLLENEDVLRYSPVTRENIKDIIIGKNRSTEPLKSFLYVSKERVDADLKAEKIIVIGTSACDLQAVKVLDRIFLEGDFVDPFYKERRDNTIIISSDCSSPRESCFCTLLGFKPYPEEGFDLNISDIGDKYIIEVGSEKGEVLVKGSSNISQKATHEDLKKQEERRKDFIKKVEDINKKFSFKKKPQDALKGKYDSKVWDEVAEKCVACSACTNICPSCHCFLLIDKLSKDKTVERYKVWDSCQSTGFARVAGGASPMRTVPERFKNRYYCKYSYKPDNFNIIACTGCGRCIEACMGKIDKREVLTKLNK